jgi:methylenetetrahydrofolate reductase (NADPH)
MTALTDAAADPAAKAALAKIVAGSSFEITARDPEKAVASLVDLAPKTPVYIAHIPGDPWARVMETALKVRDAGFSPIPHVVARNIKDEADLEEFLKTIVGELGTDHVLCLGGDVDNPPGKFTMSRQLIETGLFPKTGIKRIGLACYPEPHPKAPVEVFNEELSKKFALATEQGLNPWVVTQFAFEAEPIVGRLKELPGQGVTGPVRVGVAGPAGLKSLIGFSMRCGVGNSLKALTSRPTSIGKLMTKHTPEDVVADLALAMAKDPSLNVEGLHFFTFGGVPAAAGWMKDTLAAAA